MNGSNITFLDPIVLWVWHILVFLAEWVLLIALGIAVLFGVCVLLAAIMHPKEFARKVSDSHGLSLTKRLGYLGSEWQSNLIMLGVFGGLLWAIVVVVGRLLFS
ncbi:MAG: hypothetical protein Q7K03_09005 [Dehalococcoidia bacterium]|nr:hypothetical protein [Dehalococcoidia bacterium]